MQIQLIESGAFMLQKASIMYPKSISYKLCATFKETHTGLE